MDTFGDLKQGVQDDITVGDESTLYPPALIARAVNRAKRKAEALFPWPELQDAKKTTTQVSQNYYDYPQNWRTNSIWKVEVDYERYGEDPDGSPLSYDDFLNWVEDNPDSTDKKWANQWRRFFISPTPTVADLVICVWGLMVTPSLSDDGDTTIFSYSMPEGNEAILLEAVAILKSKGEEEKSGEFRSAEAKQILAVAWGKIQNENAKYEKDQPFFEVPDYFAKGRNISNPDMQGRV